MVVLWFSTVPAGSGCCLGDGQACWAAFVGACQTSARTHCGLQEPGFVANVCEKSQQQLRNLLYFGALIYLQMDGLDGKPQGEQVQWHDLYVSLLLLGFRPTLVTKHKRLTPDYLDSFDVIISDYHGLNNAIDAAALDKHRCKVRLLDWWGTDAIPHIRDGWGDCCLKLPSLLQLWTFTPDSAHNSFLGAAVKQEYEDGQHRRKLQVMLYGKYYGYFQRNVPYVKRIVKFAPTHATDPTDGLGV